MKIHTNIIQGSAEWHRLRALNFTASELDTFAMEPVKITLTVDEIKAELDHHGIDRKGLTKRDDLLSRLPSPEAYAKLCKGARTAIIGKIHQEKVLKMRERRERDPESLTFEENIFLEREAELDAKEQRNFEYNIPVKYGKLLEPFARSYYESRSGYEVTEVGFIEHAENSGFGCSPDGLVYADGKPIHGIEIKNLTGPNHLDYLEAGVLPDEFFHQCHAGMAVTGLERWDLILYCPGDAPFPYPVLRNDDTEKLLAGLKTLVAEKAKMKAKFAALWQAAYMGGGK